MKFLSNILVKAGLVVEGSTQLNSLAGVGTRMVVTNAAGVVSTQAIPVSSVTSVFGRTGAVVAQAGDYTTAQVTESGNLYYTDARARAAISSTATGLTYSAGVISLTAGYSIPTTASQANWDAAYAARITTANTPLSIAGNAISISQANATTNGFLSSTDWNTFNNKISGSSVAGRVAFYSGTNAITGSTELVFDSLNNRLGVSTAVPLAKVHITAEGTTGSTQPLLIQDNANVNLFYINDIGNIFVGSDGQSKQAKFFIHGIATSPFIDARSTGVTISSASNNDLVLNGNPIKFSSGATEIGRWFSTGNLRIQTGGTFTDDLFKVDVQGTVRVTGNLTTNVTSALLKTNASGVLTAAIAGTDYQTPIVNPVTGTAAAGQVTYWTGASAVSGSNNLFWDNANGRLRINGSTSPLRPLEVFNSGNWISATFSGSGGTPKVVVGNLSGNPVIGGHNDALTGWAALAINPDGGNVLIGTSSNGSQKLQVIGDTLLRGSGNTSATTALTVQNSASATMMSISNDAVNTILNISGSTYSIFQANQTTANRSAYFGSVGTSVEFGSGTAITNYTFISGGGYGLFKINTTPFNVTGGDVVEIPRISTNFNPTSGSANLTLLHMRPNINQTGGANGITRGLYVNPTLTSAADWRSIEWSNNAPPVGSNSWGLYGTGTAPNYLGGRLGLGSTVLTFANFRVSNAVTGGVNSTAIFTDSVIQSDVTNTGTGYYSGLQTAAASFTLANLRHFIAEAGTFGAGSVVTTQSGFTASSNLTGATNNYGFRGSISAATGRWNIYMDGTANNYLNGSLLIGSTTNDTVNKLQVTGTIVSGSRTSTEGSVILRGYYTSGYLTTFGTDASSGGPMISYAVESAQNSTESAFVSSTANATTPRSAYTVSANHRWFTAAASTTAVGTSIALTKRMELYNSGNLVLGGAADVAGNMLQVNGNSLFTGTINSGAITATSVQGNGIVRSDAARTAVNNDVSIALLGSNITTYAAGFSMSAGGFGLNAVYAQHEQRFGGNATFDAGNLNGGGLILNRLAPTAAGTITMNQQAGRIRTMSNLHLQTQIQGNNNITVTHMSGLHIYGHYRTTGTITLTVGDYYGVLLADPNEFSTGLTITGSNWGFYQQGAAPTNYFGGKVNIGTTAIGTSPLRVAGLPTSAAGLGAGEVWNNGGVLTIV